MRSIYTKASFLKSAARVIQLPEDQGLEVAFAGRSNVGKSSALNCLTMQKQLARTSNTPGRTQLINLFALDQSRRIVDLPGYGYAKVPLKIKISWQHTLNQYLQTRCCLKGVVLLIDSRHEPKDLDCIMLESALERQLPIHLLLTKIDKMSRTQAQHRIQKLSNHFQKFSNFISIQTFSAHTKEGLLQLVNKLNEWFVVEADSL